MPMLAVVACVAVLALMATRTKRASRHAPPVDDTIADANPRAIHDSAGPQLARLEHALEAIAIEVERVAEHQRFMTKLLTSTPPKHTAPNGDT